MMRCLLVSIPMVMACGQVHTLGDAAATADAPSIDAATDAATDVAVTAYGPRGARTPTAGVTIVFADGDGVAQATATTDGAGQAHGHLPHGGSVTAIWLTGMDQYEIETVTQVAPGDHVALIGPGIQDVQLGVFNLTWSPMPGANFYYAAAGCGQFVDQGQATTISIQARCRRDPMDASVTAYDASGNLIGYLEHAGVPFQDGGSLALTGVFSLPESFVASFANLDPTTESDVSLSRFPDGASGSLVSMSRGITGTSLQLAPTAPATANRALVQTWVSRKNASTDEAQLFAQRIDGSAFTYQLDVGAHLMPWIDQPVLNPATRTVTVPISGSGPSDLGVAIVEYSRTQGPSTMYVEWVVAAPDLAQPIALPALPGTLEALEPQPTDSIGSTTGSAYLVDDDQITGYDQVRADVMGALDRAWSDASSTSFVRVTRAVPST